MRAAEFVALEDVLRRGDAPSRARGDEIGSSREAGSPPSATETVRRDEPCARAGDAVIDAPREPVADAPRDAVADALRDARLFRARLADAFDDAAVRLLRELAVSVLARELRLAPCDLAALVRRTVEGAPCVRVRVAPDDAGREFDVPVVADAALDAGDAIVELATGSFDLRLGVRVAAVLEAFA